MSCHEAGVLNPSVLGLYVHFPFCLHKCGYCDFNSWVSKDPEAQTFWLQSLARQMDYWSRRTCSFSPVVDTLFLGGGTPSLLTPSSLNQLGDLLHTHWRFSLDSEKTMECNPETITPELLQQWFQAGITRLSVGIQSFENRYLDKLERSARREDNLRALEWVAEHWKGSWSLDLMFGLPDQSLDQWREELRQALVFSPPHLSAYQLTLTTARSRHWKQPSEDVLLEMFDWTENFLAAQGLQKYETSNFARPGFECRHNLRYWRVEPFLGLGPGAAGLLPGDWFAQGQFFWGMHQKQKDSWEQWCAGAGTEAYEATTWTEREGREALEESLMMGLRLKEGWRLPENVEGSVRGALEEALGAHQLNEFIKKYDKSWKATPRGERLLDSWLPLLFQILEKELGESLDSGPKGPKF